MTAIVAIRKVLNNKPYVAYGSDSLIVDDSEKVHAKNRHKIVKFANFSAMYAGDACWQHVLDNIKDKPPRGVFMKMKTRKHAEQFSLLALKEYKKRLKLWSLSDKEDFSDCVDWYMILASRDALFSANASGFITEAEDYLTGGSGSIFMDGLVRNNYKSANTQSAIKQLAYDAIKAACDLNTSCGGDIIVGELT